MCKTFGTREEQDGRLIDPVQDRMRTLGGCTTPAEQLQVGSDLTEREHIELRRMLLGSQIIRTDV